MNIKNIDLFINHLEECNLKEITPGALTHREIVMYGKMRGFDFTINELRKKIDDINHSSYNMLGTIEKAWRECHENTIKYVTIIYFSPTGTTKKVLEGISSGIKTEKIEFLNLAKSEKIDLKKSNTDLVIVGFPTYISRIPPEAAAKLKNLKGNGLPVVLVAVYGNNKLGDTLQEMKNITAGNGFLPIAAAAFIGEHSFSTEDMPIAAGRPDLQDMHDAKAFGKAIREKMLGYDWQRSGSNLKVPGNFPYREWHKIPAQPPETDEKLCLKFCNCKAVCPVNAISINETVVTDADLCIFCCACIKGCPVGARKIVDEKLLEIRERLYNTCSERKAPETFL